MGMASPKSVDPAIVAKRQATYKKNPHLQRRGLVAIWISG